MIKPKDPRQLAIDLLPRSGCAVRCAAVLADHWGIHAWGYNHPGPDGLGEHAEQHCMKRANWHRVGQSTIYVAAQRRRNGKTLNARPCERCQRLVSHCAAVVYRDVGGEWRML